MLKLSNTRVYGLEESVIASGYPKKTEFISDALDETILSELNTPYNSISTESNHFQRMTKLGSSPSNSGHGNALSGIIVQCDITYPQYWSMQFQRYHFSQIISSQSKMHVLSKLDLSKQMNEYVNDTIIDTIIELQKEYNFNPTYENYMKLISNCPMGLTLTMRITTNYLQLKTIYEQRKNHRLKEDWGEFCKWIENLPYFKELTGIKA
jgi:hypothetical protein